ncbi:MAG: outer membrane beta-barrel protein [Proteobacteria bacterium]|uniref:Outer membrane beta-barrel protein n=1 Tax=Candidatus Enterousia avistercoris TaxID=2840788 RepID=A0A9D9DF61_9PROT|nr:outer membrane beta-barrel protein [Candidatus Enterousia avistercoris]
MKSKVALFMAAFMFAPSAFAMEITPYVGLGVVIDKAGTSAKRVGLDTKPLTGLMGATDAAGVAEIMNQAFVRNGGDDMDFDMAFAGEITAGVKIDNVRAELEVALRSASEDDYDVFDGDLVSSIAGGMPGLQGGVPAEIETSTKVRHNSYLANVWYDFELANSNWTPYIGAGVGFGVYRQKATVDIEIDQLALKQFIDDNPMAGAVVGNTLKNIPLGERTVADDTLYRFEWQVGLGAAYNFNENWALDIGYRFNSSNVADEFVYAHEIKVGARYSF